MTYVFNVGSAVLSQDVLEKAKSEFTDYHGLGYSIIEASHRSPEFKEMHERAEATIRELLGISDDYAVLFLQGGASTQFYMIPSNLLGADQWAAYVDTGSWSTKAFKEADNLGQARVVASSKEQKYTCIPAASTWADCSDAAYVHITSNNTIAGTKYAETPATPDGVPLIADASSDIMSRPLDVSKYGMIYAGAQKNIGPAGVTLVILRRDLVARAPDSLPTMVNYNTHLDKNSTFNTPPVFGMYMIGLVAAWLQAQGGLEGIDKINRQKAQLLYDEIDADDFYRGPVATDSRSLMNVVCNLPTEELEAKFVAEAANAGLVGLKGHRSVGGVRASIYNAMPLAGVEKLAAFMRDFRQQNG